MILGAEIDDGTGPEFVFHLPDALGSTRDVVDSSGNVIRSFEHDEYGNLISSWSSGTGAATPKTWIGGLSVNDDTADSGLWNMGHRNYAAGVLGRFISRDPIGHAGNLNLYAYPTAPVHAVDPSGLTPEGWAQIVDVLEGVGVNPVLEFLDFDGTVDAIRSGQDIVCSDRKFGTRAAREATGAPPTKPESHSVTKKSRGSMKWKHMHAQEVDDRGRLRRFMPGGRSVHIFFRAVVFVSIAQGLTRVAQASPCDTERVLVEEALNFTPAGLVLALEPWIADAAQKLGQLSVKHDREIRGLIGRAAIEAGYQFNVDIRPSPLPPRSEPTFLFQSSGGSVYY